MSLSVHIKKDFGGFLLSVDLEHESGIMGLLGASGCGKSLTLKSIAGIVTPDEGRIVLNGRVLFDSEQHMNLSPQVRNVGYLFQNYALFPNMTVEKNILYGVNNRARDGKQRQEMLDYVTYIMDTFRIQHLRKKYPRQISGGEKQRTALARAIVTKPDLLLLDEPFSALDIKTKEIVYQEFLELKHAVQIPIILISHDPREGDLFADHRLYLADGHISTAI